MLGKMPADCIDEVRAAPVATSRWICSVASANTALPDAPPTESSASTSGTPAANMVDSVRHQRATVALWTRSPKIGSLSSRRSIAICILGERRQLSMKK